MGELLPCLFNWPSGPGDSKDRQASSAPRCAQERVPASGSGSAVPHVLGQHSRHPSAQLSSGLEYRSFYEPRATPQNVPVNYSVRILIFLRHQKRVGYSSRPLCSRWFSMRLKYQIRHFFWLSYLQEFHQLFSPPDF